MSLSCDISSDKLSCTDVTTQPVQAEAAHSSLPCISV